ncbi:MAG: PEP-CTERM sorting domain-containing protein, partial [Chthoniobacterales bacterium]
PLMKTTASLKVLFLACSLIPAFAFGASYIETVNGEISGNRLAPTLFTLDPGANTLSGTVITGDVDYLTFNIPVGFKFQSLTLDSYTGTGTLTKSFIGMQSGTTFTVTPAAAQPADMLGYTHYGPTGVQGEILDDIGTGSGAQGFTPPLAAGNYTFWIQETGSQARNYTFTMTMTAVPEPSVLLLVTLGMGVVIFRRRRRV